MYSKHNVGIFCIIMNIFRQFNKSGDYVALAYYTYLSRYLSFE